MMHRVKGTAKNRLLVVRYSEEWAEREGAYYSPIVMPPALLSLCLQTVSFTSVSHFLLFSTLGGRV